MIQAGSRGRGWGRLQPLEILRFKINSATKVEFCLLKWKLQFPSITVKLCTIVVLPCNLELC